MSECPARMEDFALWGILCVLTTMFAFYIGHWRRELRGQPWRLIETPVASVASPLTLNRNFLRYRRMPTYAELKNGDTPWVAPQDKNGDPDEIVDRLTANNPELASKLRAAAERAALAKGAITSDDVREALDADGLRMLKEASSPTVMATAWHPKRRWVKTGVYLPSRTPGQNKRPVAQWRLREEAAA